MAAVVVALVFQIGWLVVRSVLEQTGTAAADWRLMSLSAAGLAASYVMIAVAAGWIARRTHGSRALAYRAARSALHGNVPRARVI